MHAKSIAIGLTLALAAPITASATLIHDEFEGATVTVSAGPNEMKSKEELLSDFRRLLAVFNMGGPGSLATSTKSGGTLTMEYTGGSPGDTAFFGVIYIPLTGSRSVAESMLAKVNLVEQAIGNVVASVGLLDGMMNFWQAELQTTDEPLRYKALLRNAPVAFDRNDVTQFSLNIQQTSMSDVRVELDSFELVAIPEPATGIMLLIGMMAMLFRRDAGVA